MWRGRPRTEATSEDLLGYSGGLTDMGVSYVEGGGSGRADTITASLMSRDPEAFVEDREGGGGSVGGTGSGGGDGRVGGTGSVGGRSGIDERRGGGMRDEYG